MVTDLTMLDRDPRTARDVVVHMDEYQWLALPDWDMKVTTVSSEARYYQVRLTQTLPVLYTAFGDGPKAEHQVSGLLSNSPLQVGHFHDVPDHPEVLQRPGRSAKGTPVWRIGRSGPVRPRRRPDGVGTSALPGSTSMSTGPGVPATADANFRRGGPDHWVADALVALSGSDPAVVVVPQILFPE